MRSKTSMIASNVRLNEWALQVQECMNRPKGMDVPTWCAEHGITKANYYYRLRRVREASLTTIEESIPTFVDISELSSQSNTPQLQVLDSIAAMINIVGGPEIHISNQASQAFLENLIGAINHVE